MNYWNECIAEAFEDAGITATDEQINTVASWAEGAHDNYSMANGHDVIGNPVETQAQEELRTLKAEAEKKRQWELSTEPCKECNTSGRTRDGWGRDQICLNCRGDGRV